MRSWASAAAIAGLLASSVTAIDTISIKGTKFFYENGTQFYMKGVAYQRDVSTNTTRIPGQKYSDPLGDVAGCTRDIPLLKELQTNIIRVYAADPTINHDTCMRLLADAGIYVILDLSNPGESIVSNDPSWNVDLFKRYTDVVDAFSKYDNLFGYFAGNEVSNRKNNTAASAFVKAAVRDTKNYIKSKNYRTVGVGYATNDDKEIRVDMAAFFNCGDANESIDFWGYNVYSWCGDSSYETSGYKDRTEEYAGYNIPVFFAEYGCREVRPRAFTDVPVLFSKPMSDTWSGGIVYMYFQEENDYGLVDVDTNNEVTKRVDFTMLSSQLAKATPTGVSRDSYNPTNLKAKACPTVGLDWQARASPLPPPTDAQLCSCMAKSLRCVVGPNVDPEDYAKLFGEVCGYPGKPCAGIGKDATKGEFGAYSMCSAKDQLSFAFNSYASGQRNFNEACNFGGSAVSQAAVSPTASACIAQISQAGPQGTGTVTTPGQGGSSTSKGAAGATTVPALDLGFIRLGAYLMLAAISGGAMILL